MQMYSVVPITKRVN